MQSVPIICVLTFVIKGALSEVLFEPIQRDLNSYCDVNNIEGPVDSSLNVDPSQYMPSYGSNDAIYSKCNDASLIQDSWAALQDAESTTDKKFDPLNDVANQMLFENSNPMLSEGDTLDGDFEPMQQAQASYGTDISDEGQISGVNPGDTKYSNSLFVPNEIRLKQIMEFHSNSPKLTRSRRADTRRMGLTTDGKHFLNDLSDSVQEPIIINRKLSMLRNKPAVIAGSHDNIRDTIGIEPAKNRRSLIYGLNNDLMTTTDTVFGYNEDSNDSKFNMEFTLYTKCGCTTKCTTPCTTPCTTKCTTPCTTKCTTPCTTKCTTPCPRRCAPSSTTRATSATTTTACPSKRSQISDA